MTNFNFETVLQSSSPNQEYNKILEKYTGIPNYRFIRKIERELKSNTEIYSNELLFSPKSSLKIYKISQFLDIDNYAFFGSIPFYRNIIFAYPDFGSHKPDVYYLGPTSWNAFGTKIITRYLISVTYNSELLPEVSATNADWALSILFRMYWHEYDLGGIFEHDKTGYLFHKMFRQTDVIHDVPGLDQVIWHILHDAELWDDCITKLNQ